MLKEALGSFGIGKSVPLCIIPNAQKSCLHANALTFTPLPVYLVMIQILHGIEGLLGRLGRVLGPLGGVLGRLGGVLGVSCDLLGRLGTSNGRLEGVLHVLGRVLGRIGAVLNTS